MNSESTEGRSGASLVRTGGALLCGLLLVWLALSGHFTTWMVFLGVLSCVGVLALSIRMGIVDMERMANTIGWRIAGYFPWLIVQIVKANLDVARRILAPGCPISPTLVRIKALQKSDVGVTAFANSITLTPGTITIRAVDGMVLVHGISKEATEDLQEGEMNRRVAALEGKTTCTPSS
jgi:multicomponent Na+:H+ antiporter subunit E